jgi:hypothetical protein
MTSKEKEEILKQVKNLPEDSRDSVDLFTQSFNEFSQNWRTVLKEFDTMYSDCHKESYIKSIKEEGEEGTKKSGGNFANYSPNVSLLNDISIT